ncbi:MAG: NADH-quinone oxidoreductase subunit A [Deltaproteobacteria bacterium]|nr:NADH-quinone oxidoreductase subunit A [Deltaproteobacteria bacterium]MCB9786403.1 NADH-quinone oxidoreductase subunit A [Deltaproteobacteria bacterium]
MYEPYIPVLLIAMIVVVLAGVILLANGLLGPKRPTRLKGIPYESGVDPVDSPRHRFSVKFYMTAILFLVFDLEVVFLYPWAVNYNGFLADPGFAATAFGSMAAFLVILALGLFYEYKRGAMSWD